TVAPWTARVLPPVPPSTRVTPWWRRRSTRLPAPVPAPSRSGRRPRWSRCRTAVRSTPVSTEPADPEPGGVDLPRAESAVREFLIAIGEDPDREGLRDTPGRVARAAVEIYAGLQQKPEDVLSRTYETDHGAMVIA